MKFTDGILILIEGDLPDKTEWYEAHQWQAEHFIQAMRFGTMKSMGYPTPKEKTHPFSYGVYKYQFIIYNDWGPCYIHNMTTGKQREVQYFEIGRPYTKTKKTTFIKLFN